ncbi:MAG: hypothetical protein AAF635_10855 [Cyanobacteria bacterium P01_C01_bin.69]
MDNSKQSIGEQAINTLAKEGIQSQLDEVEALSVDIKASPSTKSRISCSRLL